MKYTLQSPVVLTDDGGEVAPSQEIADAINARLDLDKTDLAKWLHEDLDLIISCITMEVNMSGFNGIMCRTTCIADSELTPGLIKHLTDYVTGQFSDGWGETFEQQGFEISNSENFYASFWNKENWSIDVTGFSRDSE